MYVGAEIFKLYNAAKKEFPDFNSWVAEAISSEFGYDKLGPLMAAKICKTTRGTWEKPDVFERIVLVLNGREVIPDVDQDVSIKEIVFAVRVLRKEFPNDEFNDSVCQYFAAEAGEEGMLILPPELKAAQRYMPVIFLNKEQQSIQNAYLDECKVYADYMEKVSGGGN